MNPTRPAPWTLHEASHDIQRLRCSKKRKETPRTNLPVPASCVIDRSFAVVSGPPYPLHLPQPSKQGLFPPLIPPYLCHPKRHRTLLTRVDVARLEGWTDQIQACSLSHRCTTSAALAGSGQVRNAGARKLRDWAARLRNTGGRRAREPPFLGGLCCWEDGMGRWRGRLVSMAARYVIHRWFCALDGRENYLSRAARVCRNAVCLEGQNN